MKDHAVGTDLGAFGYENAVHAVRKIGLRFDQSVFGDRETKPLLEIVVSA